MILLLNGCINSGKSSTARALARLLPRAAHVELDDLRHFMTHHSLDEVFDLTMDLAVATTRVLVEQGWDAILTWPIGQEEYDYLTGQLASLNQPIHTFTLDTDLDVLLTNRGDRELTKHERRRIREQYQDGRHRPAFGRVIDNTHLTADKAAREILRFSSGNLEM